jgi:hypothetical protein
MAAFISGKMNEGETQQSSIPPFSSFLMMLCALSSGVMLPPMCVALSGLYVVPVPLAIKALRPVS